MYIVNVCFEVVALPTTATVTMRETSLLHWYAQSKINTNLQWVYLVVSKILY